MFAYVNVIRFITNAIPRFSNHPCVGTRSSLQAVSARAVLSAKSTWLSQLVLANSVQSTLSSPLCPVPPAQSTLPSPLCQVTPIQYTLYSSHGQVHSDQYTQTSPP